MSELARKRDAEMARLLEEEEAQLLVSWVVPMDAQLWLPCCQPVVPRTAICRPARRKAAECECRRARCLLAKGGAGSLARQGLYWPRT